MRYEFNLPDVGEGVHEGEVVRFLVKQGERVEVDQPIIEVQTDKVTVELPSPFAGYLTEFPAGVGQVVHVGQVIAVIETDPQPAVVAAVPDRAMPVSASAQATSPAATGTAVAQPAQCGQVLATPYTRRLARELGVEIRNVTGTGPVGRVTEEDVRRHAAGAVETPPASVITPAPAPVQRDASPATTREKRIPLQGIRKKIAEKMVLSKQTAPHVTAFDEVDMTDLIAFRSQMKAIAESRGQTISYLAFYLKALVIALREYPIFNASVDDKTSEIVLKQEFHFGIATDSEDGLIVPVVRDADRKTIVQLSEEIRDLAARARTRKLTPQEISGSTFTISNAGSIGGLYATPIINHPEVAILATHKIEQRPVVVNQEIVIRDRMNLSFSFDHRVADGGHAVRFMNRLKELLEQPESIFMELV